ncbi:hypothetical protein GF325_10465 [Candidatus Bathyarchaeota archaeon]|nr:hypothetical protein [Candidatus Bathyarchaeota archaeon]
MVTVKTYLISGFYNVQKNKFKYLFEKEIRALTPEMAVEKLKLDIASRSVNPNRIRIQEVAEITDPNLIKDRVTRTYTEEKIKF